MRPAELALLAEVDRDPGGALPGASATRSRNRRPSRARARSRAADEEAGHDGRMGRRPGGPEAACTSGRVERDPAFPSGAGGHGRTRERPRAGSRRRPPAPRRRRNGASSAGASVPPAAARCRAGQPTRRSGRVASMSLISRSLAGASPRREKSSSQFSGRSIATLATGRRPAARVRAKSKSRRRARPCAASAPESARRTPADGKAFHRDGSWKSSRKIVLSGPGPPRQRRSTSAKRLGRSARPLTQSSPQSPHVSPTQSLSLRPPIRMPAM